MNFTAEIPATITQDQLDDVLREAAGAARGVPGSDSWSWRATYPLIELLVDPWLGADPQKRTVLLDARAGLLTSGSSSNGEVCTRRSGFTQILPDRTLSPPSGRRSTPGHRTPNRTAPCSPSC